MTLQQLQYLVAIEQEGGIHAGARKVKVSQPTISVSIASLEKELGVTILFRKDKRNTFVTPAGQHIVAQAKIVLKEADLMFDIAKDAMEGKAFPDRAALITKDFELKKVVRGQKAILGELEKVRDDLSHRIEKMRKTTAALERKGSTKRTIKTKKD